MFTLFYVSDLNHILVSSRENVYNVKQKKKTFISNGTYFKYICMWARIGKVFMDK